MIRRRKSAPPLRRVQHVWVCEGSVEFDAWRRHAEAIGVPLAAYEAAGRGRGMWKPSRLPPPITQAEKSQR